MRAFRWAWTSLMVVATSLPYLIFWGQTPAGHCYAWIMPPYPEDSFAYMAWSQQAARGSLLLQLKYTALAHSPFLLHPFFLVCGWISRLTGLEIGVVHWAVKAAGVVLFFSVFYAYTQWLELGRVPFIVATVLVSVSSGFGGLFALGLIDRWHITPADLWSPEITTYWSLLWNPLFPYSLSLIVITIYWLDRGTRDARGSELWLAGLATGALALIHPYVIPMLLAYAVIMVAARQRSAAVGFLLRFFAALSPFVLYVVLVYLLQPLVARHGSRGTMKSPSLLAYALGFGLPLLIFAAGLALRSGELLKRYWQLILWFFLSLGFAYLPLWFQRKLIFGAQIPLCILAAISLNLMLNRISSSLARNRALMVLAVVATPVLISTSAYQLIRAGIEVRGNDSGAYYISDDIMTGMKFLKSNSNPRDVTFATWETSRMIPAFAGNTVVWGHWAMSVDSTERKQWNARLFGEKANWGDPQRSEDFWGSGIEYIFADGDLKSSIEHAPDKWRVILGDADKVFNNSSVIIYKRRAGQS